MNPPTRGLSSGQNPSWSLTFWNRVHRYRVLVRKYWWVLALTVSLCLFAAAWYQMNRPMTYLSTASLTIDTERSSVSLGGEQGGAPMGPEDMMAYQIPVIKGREVQQMASDALRAKYPDLLASPVSLTVARDNAILNLIATGSNAEYTQRYLQAIVKAYLDSRHNFRTKSTDVTADAIDAEISKIKEALKADDDAINDYQRQTGLVFTKDDANGANATMNAAREKLDGLKDQGNQLSLLATEQGPRSIALGNPRQGASANGATAQPSPGMIEGASGAEAQFEQATSTLVLLRAELDDLSHDLRPKHPKIIALNAKIDYQQKYRDSLVEDARKQIQERQKLVRSMIDTAQKEFDAAYQKAMEVNRLRVKFDQLEEQKARDVRHSEDLQSLLAKAMSNTHISADPIHVMESVSVAEPVPTSWIKTLGLALAGGLAVGVGVLALIDRMDDRMGSINDFQVYFSEQVLGQIPRDPVGVAEDTDLLKPDDERHQLVESFRNLRSTLLYMPMEGERPKTLLITSAVPNEGKSTVSSNLALVMAAAGMKTLLIDADLRRGAIHQKFGVSRDPGMTDVLGHNVNWKIAIRQTHVENLHVLPRGRNVPQPSEYLLNKNTDRLLQELYPLYDFIIIDSSPVLAADDTASLAPKIDATLFVTRMGFTSAKMTRKSLEILYGRQANIPGLILNQVDTSSPEFVYYQYSEYYHAATDEDEGGTNGKAEAGTKPPTPVVEV